jgi:multiple sugar transport system permease protein
MTQAEAQVPAAVAPVSTGTVRAGRTHKSGTRRRLERLLADAAVRVALLVFVVWTLAPVVWMIVSSLLNQVALTSVPPDLSLGQFTLDNYRGVLATGGSLVPALKNSLVVSLLTTGIALALGSAAAYAIARLSVPGGNTILLMTLATQMFPGIVIIIPLFIVLSRLRLIDTYAGLVLVYLSFVLPIVIWILKGFFESIPPELEKAAAVDGASTLQTFTRIVLPISLPSLFATGIFAFIESWNEFMFAIILTRLNTKTVPIAISEFAGQYQTAVGQMVAAAALASLPVIVIAIVFRKYILMGFAEGALKG